MTRKDELIQRARRRIDSIYGTRAEHCMGPTYDEYVQEVLEDLQQVEREVWEKAATGYAQWINGEDKESYPRFEDWLIAQQQELE